jgi:hypothetical protein
MEVNCKNTVSRRTPLTKNDGDKKFSMNQNLTEEFVLRSTLAIMIETNLYVGTVSGKKRDREHDRTSYSKPEATVKILMSAWASPAGRSTACCPALLSLVELKKGKKDFTLDTKRQGLPLMGRESHTDREKRSRKGRNSDGLSGSPIC